MSLEQYSAPQPNTNLKLGRKLPALLLLGLTGTLLYPVEKIEGRVSVEN